MAADMFAQATQTTIYPAEGRWGAFLEEQQHNMENIWEEVSVAAIQAGFIQDIQLREFQQAPRKKLGVKAKEFVGNIQGRWTDDGVWLVAYPLLTPDDETWIARLDVFYFGPDARSTAYEYVKNPVLTVQYLIEDRNIWDHISLVFDWASKALRLTPGENLDELDLARHISIDIHNYRHKDIFPRALTAKERDAAGRKAGRLGNPGVSGTLKRKRSIVLEDSEDEDTSAASDPSSSGSRAGAATNSDASQAGNGNESSEAESSEAESSEVESSEVESSEVESSEVESSELEKGLRRRIKTLEAMVREQAIENTELKLRLAGGSGQLRLKTCTCG